MSPGTAVCPLGLCSPSLEPCFLLLRENRGRIMHNPSFSCTQGPFPIAHVLLTSLRKEQFGAEDGEGREIITRVASDRS